MSSLVTFIFFTYANKVITNPKSHKNKIGDFNMEEMRISNKKKMRNTLFIVMIIFILLIVRIGYLQFVRGEWLTEMADEQQSLSRSITAKRGTIYDSTGKYILAVSANVETVTINPTQIKSSDKEKVAEVLSKIFE